MDDYNSNIKNSGKNDYFIYFLSDSMPAFFEKNHKLLEFANKYKQRGRFFYFQGHCEESIEKFIDFIGKDFALKKPDLVVLHFSHERYKSQETKLESLVRGYEVKVIINNPNNGLGHIVDHIKKELKMNI